MRISIYWASCLATIFAGSAALGVIAACIHSKGIFSQETAAWVQGVGTIGAIVGMVWVDQGAAHRTRRERAERHAECRRAMTGAREYLAVLLDAVDMTVAGQTEIAVASTAERLAAHGDALSFCAESVALRVVDVAKLRTARRAVGLVEGEVRRSSNGENVAAVRLAAVHNAATEAQAMIDGAIAEFDADAL